jgi:hypothetical protein
MKPPKALLENSRKCLAHAKELHADADAAQQRSSERKQNADCAHATMERLRGGGIQWLRNEAPLEMAERHVAEAERHIERQRKLLEELIRDKHERMLGHARKVLEVLEQSLKLARVHRDLEREFHSR